MAELKPCPFCRRIPIIADCGNHRYFVKCKCGIEQSKLYWQKCDAVKRWNTRKDEPQTNTDQHVERIECVGNDGGCRCWKCKHFKRMHQTPISSDGRYCTYVVCTASKCRYESKDEPQTETQTETKNSNATFEKTDCQWK